MKFFDRTLVVDLAFIAAVSIGLAAALSACGVEPNYNEPTEAQVDQARHEGKVCMAKGLSYKDCVAFCYDRYPRLDKRTPLGLGNECKAAAMQDVYAATK